MFFILLFKTDSVVWARSIFVMFIWRYLPEQKVNFRLFNALNFKTMLVVVFTKALLFFRASVRA